MVSSKYNLLFKANKKKEDEYVLYNTLSNAIFVVSKDIKDSLTQSGMLENIADDTRVDFEKEGVLVNDDVNELAIFKVRAGHQKYSGKKSVFMVTVTYACNCACPYCFEGDTKKNLSNKGLNSIIEFIKKRTTLHGSEEVEIQLFGGEPLLKPDTCFKLLDELEAWAKGRNVKLSVIVYTNGTIGDEEILKKFAQFNIRYFHITLDGIEADHNKRRFYRNGNGTYKDTMKTLEILKKMKIECKIRINIDQDNYMRADQVLDDLKIRNFQNMLISFGFIRPLTAACSSYAHNVSDGLFAKSLPKLWRLALKKGFNKINYLKPHQFYVYCSASTVSSYVVDLSGDVYKCASLQGIEEHKIGSISDDGELTDLRYTYYDWMSRDPVMMDKCKKCNVLPSCGGGCSGGAYTKHGTYHANDCLDRNQKMIQERVMIYLESQYPDKFSPIETGVELGIS